MISIRTVALAVSLGCVFSPAQSQTYNPNAANGSGASTVGHIAIWANTTGTLLADGGAAVINPLLPPYNAKCDGATDDTAAFQAVATAINAAGGATDVQFPLSATCLVYNSGQSISTPLFSLNTGSVKSAHFHFNGTTLQVGHTFTGSELLAIFNLIGGSYISVDGVNVTQTTPVGNCSTPHGSVLISSTGGTSNILLTNSTMTGGQGPFEVGNATNATLINVSSVNSCYGVIGLNGLVGLTVRGFHASGLYRDIFLKGVTDADISLDSINPVSNSVLISADANSEINDNIRINYKVFPRTAAASSPASYITIGPTTSLSGTVYRNFNINIDIDMSGDTAGIGSAVKFIKNTASALSSVFENIVFSGRVNGVPHYIGSAPVFDIFTVADQNWNGETAANISFENMYVTGDTSPVFYVDYAPFLTSPNGQFSLRNVVFPGNYTDANNSNIAGQRLEINSSFANHQGAMNPSFGGTGIFQPAAHSIPITEGAAVFNLAAPSVAGRLLMDKGASADPAFALGYPVFLGGFASAVNLNSANTDTAITISNPTTNYMVDKVIVVNNGSTASLTTATAGVFTATGGGGEAIASTQSLSAITSNSIGTDSNSLSLTTLGGARTAINSATVQFRVVAAQGAAATGNVYVYIRPLP